MSSPFSAELQDREIIMYRFGLLVGAFAIPVTGLFYKLGNPGAFDSWAARFAIGGFCLAIAILSMVNTFVKKNLDLFFYGLMYVFLAWTDYLFFQNHYSSVYFVGIFVTLFFSSFINYRNFTQLFVFLGLSVATIGVTSWFVTSPQTNPLVVVSLYAVLALIVGISLWSKINMQRKLKESEESLFTIFNESADAIFLIDPVSFSIHNINGQGVRLSGAGAKKDVIGFSIKDFFIPVDPYLQDAWLPTEANGGQSWNGQYYLKTKDGRMLWVDIAMRPVLLSGSRMISLRFADVTRIQKAERELESKAKQLAWNNAELGRVNLEMARREARMVELMKQVEQLKAKLQASTGLSTSLSG